MLEIKYPFRKNKKGREAMEEEHEGEREKVMKDSLDKRI